MTDAFLGAGARAVIGSLYRAPDAGARAFAEAFYRAVLDGQTWARPCAWPAKP